jgi:hypothetical protein
VRILPKEKMMDDETLEQKLEKAWDEGARATRQIQTFNGTATRTVNPYTPEVECTPTLQEMNAVLLSEFTQEEIWRGEKQREGQLAEHERVMIVEELKTFEAEILEGEMMFRAGLVDLRKLDTVRECIALIKRKWN